MALLVSEGVALLLAAVTGGMFWGPWLALTRHLHTFRPEVLLAITDRLNRNMAALMTPLLPLTLLALLPVLWLTYGRHPATFSLTLLAFGSYLTALLVTMRVEVPIVKQIVGWTVYTLPPDWQRLRDRWAAFHVVRVAAVLVGLACLIAGVVAG